MAVTFIRGGLGLSVSDTTGNGASTSAVLYTAPAARRAKVIVYIEQLKVSGDTVNTVARLSIDNHNFYAKMYSNGATTYVDYIEYNTFTQRQQIYDIIASFKLPDIVLFLNPNESVNVTLSVTPNDSGSASLVYQIIEEDV